MSQAVTMLKDYWCAICSKVRPAPWLPANCSCGAPLRERPAKIPPRPAAAPDPNGTGKEAVSHPNQVGTPADASILSEPASILAPEVGRWTFADCLVDARLIQGSLAEIAHSRVDRHGSLTVAIGAAKRLTDNLAALLASEREV